MRVLRCAAHVSSLAFACFFASFLSFYAHAFPALTRTPHRIAVFGCSHLTSALPVVPSEKSCHPRGNRGFAMFFSNVSSVLFLRIAPCVLCSQLRPQSLFRAILSSAGNTRTGSKTINRSQSMQTSQTAPSVHPKVVVQSTATQPKAPSHSSSSSTLSSQAQPIPIPKVVVLSLNLCLRCIARRLCI